MDKKLKFWAFIFGVIIVVLLAFTVANYRIFHTFVNNNIDLYIQEYGYLAVFIFVFLLEISPQPFFSGLIPLASGMALGLSDPLLLIVSIISVIFSSLAGYAIGWKYGKKPVLSLIDKQHYDRYSLLVKKHGDFAIAIAANTPIPYLPILAGAFKMHFRNFIVFGVLFRILHFLIFGYLFTVLF